MTDHREPADSPAEGVTTHGAILLTGGTTGIGLGAAQELVLLGFRKFILGYATHDEYADAAKRTLEQNRGVKAVLVKDAISCDTELYPKAFWRLVERGVPYMEKSPHEGRIIVLSNPGVNLMSSPRPIYLFPGCGKTALEYMARHYARVLAPKRITYNVVIPGITKTNWKTLDPTELAAKRCLMKEVIQPEDVGAAIAFLVSPKARFVTGAFLPVDGGLLFV